MSDLEPGQATKAICAPILRSQSELMAERPQGPETSRSTGLCGYGTLLDRLAHPGAEGRRLRQDRSSAYPQRCVATTATVNDKAFQHLGEDGAGAAGAAHRARLSRRRHLYRSAGQSLITRYLSTLDWQPEKTSSPPSTASPWSIPGGRPLLLPVPEDCPPAARKARPAHDQFMITFQSRFDRSEWLQPYTDKTIEQLAREWRKRSPGSTRLRLRLSRDARGNRRTGGAFVPQERRREICPYPSLNDSDDGMAVLEKVVRRELLGWV